MASVIKTYNSRQVIIALGSHNASGMADDSFVTIEEKGEGVLSKTGCDGEVARAIDPCEQYTVKMSFLQMSDTSSYRVNTDSTKAQGKEHSLFS